MKGFLIAAAFGLGLLGASVPTAGSALAWDKGDHRTYKGPVYKYVGVWLSGAPHHHTRPSYRRGHHDYRLAHRRARRHDRRERYLYSAPWRAYRQRRMDNQATRPCHATSKVGFDHGRRARIGGTMCYDTYGSPYIVRGSRYIIRYF